MIVSLVIALQAQLGRADPLFQIIGSGQSNDQVAAATDSLRNNLSLVQAQKPFIVALGTSGLREALEQNSPAPIFAVLITSTSYYQIASSKQFSSRRKVTAVFADPDPNLQIRLARALLGEHRRISVAFTSNSQFLTKAIHEPNIDPIFTESNTLGGWLGVLEGDALLAVPDADIYNRNDIRSILTTLYHRNIALIGYNEALVKAGALASLQSTPEQLAKQLVEKIEKFERDGVMEPPSYPRYYEIVVNRQLAQSLNVRVPAEELLRAQIQDEVAR